MSEEDHKLYTLDYDGNYTLNFPNRKALTNEEISKKFSQFGEVLSVRAAGDERGFRFVRYATKEEALKAIIGLKNDPHVKLVIRKPKDRNQPNKNQTKGNFQDRKNFKSENNHNRNRNDNDEEEAKSVSNGFEDDCETKSHKSGNFNFKNGNKRFQRSIQENGDNINKSELKSKCENSLCLDTIKNGNSTAQSEETCSVKSHKSEMPMLVPAKQTVNQSQEIIVPAQEVVVANVHDNYGPAFILHLIEKYDPIFITKMIVIKSLNVRFCHVFFKTANDAKAVIEDFDNYNLMGKRLIVLTP